MRRNSLSSRGFGQGVSGERYARVGQMRKRAIKIFLPSYTARRLTTATTQARRRGLWVATPIAFGFHFAQVCVIINPEMEVNVESYGHASRAAPRCRFFPAASFSPRRSLLSFFFMLDKKEAWHARYLRERFRG